MNRVVHDWVFVSDLHGRIDRYEKLFRLIKLDRPESIFLGGDLMPSALSALTKAKPGYENFLKEYLAPKLAEMKRELSTDYPRIFVILGNDDAKSETSEMYDIEAAGLWEAIHGKKVMAGEFSIYGYSCVPPTPFLLKDWERYDVSGFVEHGCVSPEEGFVTVEISEHERRYSTIRDDLKRLIGSDDASKAIFLFHSPPHRTNLDRAALDGKSIDHAPVDVHVGSVAIRRMIESKQPLLTLHGHIHESARMTRSWRDVIGRTHLFSAAHDGPELAVVQFNPECPDEAYRELF